MILSNFSQDKFYLVLNISILFQEIWVFQTYDVWAFLHKCNIKPQRRIKKILNIKNWKFYLVACIKIDICTLDLFQMPSFPKVMYSKKNNKWLALITKHICNRFLPLLNTNISNYYYISREIVRYINWEFNPLSRIQRFFFFKFVIEGQQST